MGTPEEVEDGVLEEAEIGKAVRGLKGGISVVLYGMWEEDLKRWLQEASWEKNLVRRRW